MALVGQRRAANDLGILSEYHRMSVCREDIMSTCVEADQMKHDHDQSPQPTELQKIRQNQCEVNVSCMSWI